MTLEQTMRRFWFQFEKVPQPTALNLGCGVTAFDRDDAIAIVNEFVSVKGVTPNISGIIDDVDLSGLEDPHIHSNIGTYLCAASGFHWDLRRTCEWRDHGDITLGTVGDAGRQSPFRLVCAGASFPRRAAA